MNDTVTIPTSELEGAALDWAVAKAECAPVEIPASDVVWRKHFGVYSPSTDWRHGGELIHKYMFDFEWVVSDWHGEPIEKFCVAHGYGLDCEGLGPTHLIAACRAIVAARLGDEVQVPRELLP